jgi:P2 family phage contractile tail tube protein
MPGSIEKILNANVYINDINFVGRATEIDIVHVKVKTTDHQTLPMVGPLQLFQGIEKMEAGIKWAAFNADVLVQLVPTMATKLTIRVAQQVYEASSVVATDQVRAVMVGRVIEESPQALKAGEGSVETKFAIDSYTKWVAGVPVLAIDIPNYIYMVEGVDVYADVRAALGV